MGTAVYLYRWKIKLGFEKQFEDNWSIVTKGILEQCGSYGSRLHISGNGEYVAYAQWPSVQTREQCVLNSTISGARILMQEAIEFSYPDELLQVKLDHLVSP